MDSILEKNLKKRIKEYYKNKSTQDDLFNIIEKYFGTIHDRDEMRIMVNEIIRHDSKNNEH